MRHQSHGGRYLKLPWRLSSAELILPEMQRLEAGKCSARRRRPLMPSAPMALPTERKPLPFQLANLGTNSGFEEEILSGCCLYFTRTIKTTTKKIAKSLSYLCFQASQQAGHAGARSRDRSDGAGDSSFCISVLQLCCKCASSNGPHLWP